MTAPLDQARLRELAEAATPGEWQHMKGREMVRAMRGDFCIPLVEVLEPYGDPLLDAPTCRVGKEVVFRANSQGAKDSAAMKQAFRNAAFIASANPATILALLNALSAERERADRAVKCAEQLSAAISWTDYPFIDNNTGVEEIRSRLGFMQKDAERPREQLGRATQSTSRTGEG